MKKICSCYDKLDAGEKRIVVRTHTFFNKGVVYPCVYCAQCGKPSFVDDTALIIDIEEFNIPLKVIVEEFNILQKDIISQKLTLNTMQKFNILYAIAWAYEVDYYQKFDKYFFRDVRNAIINYFVEYKKELNKCFLDEEYLVTEYLSYVENILVSGKYESINLKEVLEDPNIFTSLNHSLYGPASLVHNEFVDTLGTAKKSNNFYYSSDKHFREHQFTLEYQAKKSHVAILQMFCNYLLSNCVDLPPTLFFEIETLQDLKNYITKHNSCQNRLVVTGFLRLFKDILDNVDKYLNLTSRTYKDYLNELERAENFVKEHLE